MEKINNEFDVKFQPKKEYKKLPTNNLKMQENVWKDNSNKKLKERGSNKRVYNRFWHNLFKCFFVFVIIGFMGGFLWLVSEGYFKTEVNQEVNLEPQINNEVNNEYEFNPNHTIIVYNNLTIINKIYNQTG